MGRIKLTDEQRRIAENVGSSAAVSRQQSAVTEYRGGRIRLDQKQEQIAAKYGLKSPSYRTVEQTQQTVADPLHQQYAAFMAYQNALREWQVAQTRQQQMQDQAKNDKLNARERSGEKKTPQQQNAVPEKVSQQEFARSSAMQQQYGTYDNYLRGVDAAQGKALGTQLLRQQSAALAGLVPFAAQQQKEDHNKWVQRQQANEAVRQAQERGMTRTSRELAKQIDQARAEQAASNFADYTYEDGRAVGVESEDERLARIAALEQRKTIIDNQRAMQTAQQQIGALDDETRQLLAQYNRGAQTANRDPRAGMTKRWTSGSAQGNGTDTSGRAYGQDVSGTSRQTAYQQLLQKGYTPEQIGKLAEYEQYLQDYADTQTRVENAQQFAQQLPGVSDAVSSLIAPFKALGNIESVRGALPSWMGGYKNEDMPTNIYSGLYGATQVSGAIRDTRMQGLNEAGQFVYQALMSAADSAVNMGLSAGLVGVIGGVSGAAAQDAVASTMNWVMGSQVAADSVYQGIQAGKSNTDALIDGIVEGAIEGITEKYSVGDIIENMLSGKAVWKKALRSFASEGAEEVASNWLNRAYDVVAKHGRSEVLAAYGKYIAQGMTQAQALAATVSEFAKEDGLSFLAGGISGLAMSTAYATTNHVLTEKNVAQVARAVVEAGQVQDVIDYGLAQKEGTKAHKLAEAMQQTVDAGEEVTVKDAENVLREVVKEQQAAVEEGEEPRAPENVNSVDEAAQQAEQAQQTGQNAAEAAQGTREDEKNKTFEIYKDSVKTAQQAAQRVDELGRVYDQEQKTKTQSAAETVRQAEEQAKRALESDSMLAPSESMAGIKEEMSAERFAQMQMQDIEQELEAEDAQQVEDYLEQRAARSGYDEQTASYFVNGNVTGLPVEQYAERFAALYQQGAQGAGWQYAQRYAQGMNPDVARAAWQGGLAAGQKGAGNGNQTAAGNGQGRNAGKRGSGKTHAVAEGAESKKQSNAEGRKRAQSARNLAKTWQEVSCRALGLGEKASGTVRVMPETDAGKNEDIQQAAKYLKSVGVQNVRFFTGQLQQTVGGETIYAEGAVLEDGTVLIRADSEHYSAAQLARHEGYHILAERYPAMASRIRARLLREGKITQKMIEDYIEAYHRAYGDNIDAYANEIVADAYAGMNRTGHTTAALRADVRIEVRQETKKPGSARAPPGTKLSAAQNEDAENEDAENEMPEDDPNYSYRYTMKEGIMGTRGDAMFADDPDRSSHFGKENPERYKVSHDKLVDFEDLRQNIIDKIKEGYENWMLPDDMQQALDDGTTVEEIAEQFNPEDIVDWADAWDNDDWTQWFWENIGEENEVKGVKTNDGAIVFDKSIIETEKNPHNEMYLSVSDEAQEQGEARYVTNARNDLLRDLQGKTGIPFVWGAELVRQQVDTLVNAAQKGELTQELVDDSFAEIWDAGKKLTRQFAEENNELLKTIQQTAITPTEDEQKTIRNPERFRARAKGKFRLADKGGASIAETYRELAQQLPEIFPPDIGEKQMAEALLRGVQQMQKAKNLAESFRGSNSTVWEERAKADYQTAVREMANDLRKARQQEEYVRSRQQQRAAPQPVQEVEDVTDAAVEKIRQQERKQETLGTEIPDYEDIMPTKAADYIRRAENRLVNELAYELGVPGGRQRREPLHEAARKAINEFLATGELNRESVDAIFSKALEEGRVLDTAFYDQYKDLKDLIRDTTITISEQDKADIADFETFRKAAFGTVKIGKDGRQIDGFYQELREAAPELFPENITAPSDQLLQIVNVARSIQRFEWTLDQYWGEQAESFKDHARAQFSEAVDRLVSGLRLAERYRKAQKKTEEKLAIPQNAKEAAALWPQLKAAKKAFEKTQGKMLLTEEDQAIVSGLLRGSISTQTVEKLENGAQILRAYEAKAEFDLLALRLKAWNIQRKQGLRDFAEQALTEAEAAKWVDKVAGIQYSRETMERNIRDIARKGKISDVKTDEFINKFFWPVHENESKRSKYVREIQEKIRALGLSQKVEKGNLVSESYAVQWLGEAEFNAEYLKKHPRVQKRGGMELMEWQAAIQDFQKLNPKLNMEKIRNAVKVFHEVYDELFRKMNLVRVENGYEPVDYLYGYFPHFQENDPSGTLLQRFAKALGVQGDVTPLPTTINGLTAVFKPGIRYMANIQQRLGYATAYDALKGMDQYLEVASDVIFHTEDIQRLRALATQLRYRASDEGIRKQIDALSANPMISPETTDEQIKALLKDGKFALSGLVAELDEYTNLLAGKKSRLDRGAEHLLGRKFYNVMKNIEQRVGANMVAANIGSALTNFIPITQAWTQVSTADMISGMLQTIRNYAQADGLDEASTFITNRAGYDRLSVTNMDKASAVAGWLMETVDGFTTGSVVRARYLNNLKRGLSETNAMQEADQFAASIMADRSKGSTPTLFNARNPLVKAFTQFQLEVNNELSWIFKDMAREERKKGVLALTKAIFKFLIGAWIYNELYEAVIGRRAALDPLDMINDTVGDFTGYHLPNMVTAATNAAIRGDEIEFKTEKKNTADAIAGLEGRILSEIPGQQFLAMFDLDDKLGIELDGGRIAVASAIPDISKIRKAIWADKGEMSAGKRVSDIANELANPAAYLALPFGGGQVKKMVQGSTAVVQGGSYKKDNEGNDILQYPVYSDRTGDTAINLAQALLFGKSATEAAREWVEGGFKSLSAKETAAYQTITEAGEDQRDTYAFILSAKKLKADYDKKMLLKASALSDEAKTEYYYNVLAGDTAKAEMDELGGQERIDYVKNALAKAEDDHNRDELRDAVLDGTVSDEKAMQRLVANDWATDENDAYWKVRTWKGGKDYHLYDTITETIETGGDVKKAAQEYLDHGKDKSDIGRGITTYFKPLYLAASAAERRQMKNQLLDAYAAIGFDRAAKAKDIDKWLEDEK